MSPDRLSTHNSGVVAGISAFRNADAGIDSARALDYLVQSHKNLPAPGSGHTLDRWRLFASLAAQDLSCAKLFESHADALAILHELGHKHLISDGELWAVWCSEPPSHRLLVSGLALSGPQVTVSGIKAWCSGAALSSNALVSCWDEQDHQYLVALDMKQPGVQVSTEGWHAVGMAATASVDVIFDHARALVVGRADEYLKRPGFMHGAAGIAACWYGAACSIAAAVIRHVRRYGDDCHAMAHLGAMDVALAQAAGLLIQTAHAIDARPLDKSELLVRRARLAVEAAVETVLIRAPRAFGAGPLCKDPRLARQFADLPIFVRQSHAERDLASHATALLAMEDTELWRL